MAKPSDRLDSGTSAPNEFVAFLLKVLLFVFCVIGLIAAMSIAMIMVEATISRTVSTPSPPEPSAFRVELVGRDHGVRVYRIRDVAKGKSYLIAEESSQAGCAMVKLDQHDDLPSIVTKP